LQNLGFTHSTFSGSSAQVGLKVTSNGKFLIHNDINLGKLEILKFNTLNSKLQINKTYSKNYSYMQEFSASNAFLYLNYLDSFIQIDINSNRRFKFNNINSSQSIGQTQLGNDGKLYGIIANSKDLMKLNNPDSFGSKTDMKIIRNFFSNSISTSLPNFNQSYFYTPALDYSYQLDCRSNNIELWGKDTLKPISFSGACANCIQTTALLWFQLL
jgi:hypothetical protein